jgi:integrase/recombinase XerD
MPSISLYLDDRKTRDIEPPVAAPLKLRVYISRANIKHCKTNISLTRSEFNDSYIAAKPAGKQNKEQKIIIEAIKVKADEILKNLGDHFTFEKFEKQFYRNRIASNDVITHYNTKIETLQFAGKESTADLYRLSLLSILKFASLGRKNILTTLRFDTLTPKFLEAYEKWFINYTTNGQSKTSVGIYLRNLRHIFNEAIKAGDIHRELYPFEEYTIPNGKNIKKALLDDTLKILYIAEVTPCSHIEIARDYWFLSFMLNGCNFRDIAELKYKNINDTSISFLRHKTQDTTKDEPILIMVPLTDKIRAHIEKYGVKNCGPNDYIFPIFTKQMNEKEKLRVNRNFIRYVNGHMQNLAEKLKIGFKVRTMEARHSFTTKATKAKGLEFAQQALGHTSLSTTQNYWAGFDHKIKIEVAEQLMDFLDAK